LMSINGAAPITPSLPMKPTATLAPCSVTDIHDISDLGYGQQQVPVFT
jgi:hypothetical protein